ncbi:DUF2515 family protein [Halalkalibacter krulwichiae]|uniref:DUF2515 domain-containing protein n=1 Tax=Halalkalibacter krulwichiae TaxID=199441 RepID=A0A1X9MCI2_9BACI|nr:DUF2515 family protein [Halalkalibacter krulwichiae]ARK30354.1 hypothetical protein BkAM31D_11245 [Halalkalibacter krulwichiae]
MLTKLKTEIVNQSEKGNVDNISRTIFYEQFFKNHPEIIWSLLAGIVSRNAGWNMTDLKSEWFQVLLKKDFRNLLFHTYERANWTIFADAYPQLLWYAIAKETGKPEFELLEQLQVSRFMQREWRHFLNKRDKRRLCTALIINEQYMLEQTVMKNPLYRDKVFSSLLYNLEEYAHMSYVIFPTVNGQVFGLYVRNFKNVTSRIWLGKQLQQLLFHPFVHQDILQFTIETPPTGSRDDYQQYMKWKPSNTSPLLREVYPVVTHHWKDRYDWSEFFFGTEKLFADTKTIKPVERTRWLHLKWVELFWLKKMKEVVF